MNKMLHRTLAKVAKYNILGLKKSILNVIAKRKFDGVIMDLSSTCNAKCPYCPRYMEGRPFENNGFMSEEIFETLYKQIEENKNIKDISLYAYGEPLLNPDAGKYIRRLSELKRFLILSTNTTNMDKFTDDLMLIDLLQYSVEGWDKESYERTRKNLKFEKTLEQIKNFREAVMERRKQNLHTPLISIHCLYTKKTDLDAFIKLWSPYVDEMRFTAMGPYPAWEGTNSSVLHYPEDINDELFHFTKKISHPKLCPCLKNKVTLNALGKVTLCCSDFTQKFNLGDYRDINAAFYNKFLDTLAQKWVLGEPNVCEGCVLAYEKPSKEIRKAQPKLKYLKKYNTKNFKIKK